MRRRCIESRGRGAKVFVCITAAKGKPWAARRFRLVSWSLCMSDVAVEGYN